jgi:hypothetical protein
VQDAVLKWRKANISQTDGDNSAQSELLGAMEESLRQKGGSEDLHLLASQTQFLHQNVPESSDERFPGGRSAARGRHHALA